MDNKLSHPPIFAQTLQCLNEQQLINQPEHFLFTIDFQKFAFQSLISMTYNQLKNTIKLILYHIFKHMYRGDPNKYKKRLNISSLGAAICNVAVFKSMKQRQFKDEIFISYSEDGVIVEAESQYQWQKVSRFVDNFLNNKKISLLAFGYDKQVYEELIINGLKHYTRKMKELGQQCPYINIIHYQKLRKSCEYMDKERYIEPLKDWERKNKKNPNFAFLIVEPIHKYEDVKKRLLECLLKKQVSMSEHYFSCLYFILLAFTSSIKQEIKQNFDKTYIQVSLQKNTDKKWVKQNNQLEQYRIKVVNYTSLKLDEIDYKIVSSSKNLSRLGLQYISSKQIDSHIKKIKTFITGNPFSNKIQSVSSSFPFEVMQNELIKKHGQDYCIIPFKKSQKQKYNAVISKFTNVSLQKDISQLAQQINKNIFCGYDEIQFLGEENPDNSYERGYKIHRVCIDDCPYMIHQYKNIPICEVDTFLLYIQQLKTYYCTYIVRFYGISIKYGHGAHGQIPANMSFQQKIQGYTYFLIYDYHHKTIKQMVQNDMILDNFQIANMVLQIIYLINFLHTHQEPRSLGSLKIDEIYWPLRIVLPYLKNSQQLSLRKQESNKRQESHIKGQKKVKGNFKAIGQGFQGDVKLTGLVMKLLLQAGQEDDYNAQDQDDHFSDLIKMMLKQSKYERITLTKCMSTLQELLMIN